jgi:hypothetical protein
VVGLLINHPIRTERLPRLVGVRQCPGGGVDWRDTAAAPMAVGCTLITHAGDDGGRRSTVRRGRYFAT